MKCIDEEIPFEIPQSWCWERWGNLSQSIQYGYNAPAVKDGVIRMVRISDIQNGNVLWDSVPFCNIMPEDIDSYILQPNDILFARTGGTVGKSYIVHETPYPAIYAGYLIRTRYSKNLCPQYMKYFMESSLYWTQLREGTIATAQPNCNGQTLSKMIFPIPPAKEQERIVYKLNTLFSKTNEYDSVNKELRVLNETIREDIKKSILQYAIQGKLVTQNATDEPASVLLDRIKAEKTKYLKEGKLKKKDLVDTVILKGDDNKYYEKTGNSKVCIDEEVPFEIPESWIWARLGDIAAISAGGTPDRTNNRYWNNGDIPWLKISDVTSSTKYVTRATEFITQEGLENSSAKIYKKGTILYTIFATVGEVAILDFDSTCNQAIAGIDLYDKELTSWVYYFLANLKDYIISISKGCAQLNINQKILKSVLIPIPPKKEQTRIISCLDEIISSIMSR